MTTIPVPGSELRHVRKTITFDGSANNGALGDLVTVFTVTGSVIVRTVTGHVTSALVCAAGNDTGIRFRIGADYDWIQWAYASDLTVADSWIGNGSGLAGGNDLLVGSWAVGASASANVNILVQNIGSGANVTAGTIVVDCWYTPITDDGALAGDDIDEVSRDYIWEAATRTLTSISALESGLADAVWAKTMTELAAVPGVTGTVLQALEWLFLLNRNKVNQTSGQQTLRNDADNANLAAASVSDDGTTFTRGEWG